MSVESDTCIATRASRRRTSISSAGSDGQIGSPKAIPYRVRFTGSHLDGSLYTPESMMTHGTTGALPKRESLPMPGLIRRETTAASLLTRTPPSGKRASARPHLSRLSILRTVAGSGASLSSGNAFIDRYRNATSGLRKISEVPAKSSMRGVWRISRAAS
jgi:hypothetical protein